MSRRLVNTSWVNLVIRQKDDGSLWSFSQCQGLQQVLAFVNTVIELDDAESQGKHLYGMPAPVRVVCNDCVDQREHDGGELIVRRNKVMIQMIAL